MPKAALLEFLRGGVSGGELGLMVPPEVEPGRRVPAGPSGEKEVSLSFKQLPKARWSSWVIPKELGIPDTRGACTLTSFSTGFHWALQRKRKGKAGDWGKPSCGTRVQKVTSGHVGTGLQTPLLNKRGKVMNYSRDTIKNSIKIMKHIKLKIKKTQRMKKDIHQTKTKKCSIKY